MSSGIALVVPFHAGEPLRERNWGWLAHRYRMLHPNLELVTAWDGACGTDDWSKARAVNRAELALPEDIDVVVVADADSFVDPAALSRAIACAWSVGWAMPHGAVYRLNARASSVVCSTPVEWMPTLNRDDLEREPTQGKPGGGIVCVARYWWRQVGGFDPRFCGWGGEDVSLGWSLGTLCSPGIRVGAPLWHLHHPTARRFERAEYRDALTLVEKYQRANGDPDAMRMLIRSR